MFISSFFFFLFLFVCALKIILPVSTVCRYLVPYLTYASNRLIFYFSRTIALQDVTLIHSFANSYCGNLKVRAY